MSGQLWRPEAESREFQQLLRLEVDFEDPPEVMFRRLGEETSAQSSNAAVKDQSVATTSKFRPINQEPATASSSRTEPVISTSAAVTHGNLAVPEHVREQAGIIEGEDGGVELRDRDWEIARVDSKRLVDGVVEYHVQWASTSHPTAVLQRHEGMIVVVVEGRRWPVVHEATVNGDQTATWVQWRDSWHPVWELTDALGAVKEYEEQRPETPTATKLERSQRPQFWKFPRRISSAAHPKPVGVPDNRRAVTDTSFEPEFGADYTMGLLEYLRTRIGAPDEDMQKSPVLEWLNTPPRQPLTFVEGRAFVSFEHESRLRSMLASVIGFAQNKKCRECESGIGPFVECVVVDDKFMGACTNCVYRSLGSDCCFNHKARRFHLEEPRDGSTPDPSTAGASSSPRSAESRSSTPSVNAAGYSTPASSPPNAAPAQIQPRTSSPELGDDIDINVEPRRSDPAKADSPERSPAIAAALKSRRSREKPQRDIFPASGQKRVASDDAAAEPSSGECAKKRSRVDEKPEVNQARDAPILAAAEEIVCKAVDDDAPDSDNAKVQSPEDDHRHATCDPAGLRPCHDPVIGCPADQRPPIVVYNDERFERAEASEDQVRFIISHCNCEKTRFLHSGWEEWLCAGDATDVEFDSKEEYLSIEYSNWLNVFVQACCPSRNAFQPGEIIDLATDSEYED